MKAPYPDEWVSLILNLQDQIARLEKENSRLRQHLVGTRSVLVQLRELQSGSLTKGFDMWIAKIDEGLK